MGAYRVRPYESETYEAELSFVPPLVRRLLVGRGLTTQKEAEVFLSPDWERDSHDPFLMKDMDLAVERILTAVRENERIAIWSDYDMDGIPGAVVLWDFFARIGYANVVHHTPHRNRDGFGLNTHGLDMLRSDGVSFVITIDCGIGDVEQVAYANSIGLSIIVTDHHLPGAVLPPAYAVINPKRSDCTYPEKMLCGAAVAFKLVQGLLRSLTTSNLEPKTVNQPPIGWDKWLLDMAGMSTIADMVPLRGENRLIAHFGLVVLRKSRRVGLQALLKKARADQRTLTEDDIGFTIAPRINAASRMGHAKDAFALLAATDPLEAGVLADHLEQINKERKGHVAAMTKEAHARLKSLGEPNEVIVLGNPDWKPSLLGLVANTLADTYARPVFLWGREEGATIKGSCRSEGTTSVHELMRTASSCFIEYGGHSFSGGFSITEEQLILLEPALCNAYVALGERGDLGTQVVDAELTLADVTWQTYREVARLAPFGEGNPKPVFLLSGVRVASTRMFGKSGEHLEVVLNGDGGKSVKAIAFFAARANLTPPMERSTVNLTAHFEASYFGRTPELRLRIISIEG